MDEARIPTYIWVEAKVRDLNNALTPTYVVKKGNRTGGMVAVKVLDRSGLCCIYTQQRDLMTNHLIWQKPLGDNIDEKTADQFIIQECEFDPDLWVIEIEDQTLINPFEG